MMHTAAVSFVDKRGATPTNHLRWRRHVHQGPLREPLARATSPAHPSHVRSCCQVHSSLLFRPPRRVARNEQENPRLVSPQEAVIPRRLGFTPGLSQSAAK